MCKLVKYDLKRRLQLPPWPTTAGLTRRGPGSMSFFFGGYKCVRYLLLIGINVLCAVGALAVLGRRTRPCGHEDSAGRQRRRRRRRRGGASAGCTARPRHAHARARQAGPGSAYRFALTSTSPLSFQRSLDRPRLTT